MSLQMPLFSAKDLDVDILLALDPMRFLFLSRKAEDREGSASLVFGGLNFERAQTMCVCRESL